MRFAPAGDVDANVVRADERCAALFEVGSESWEKPLDDFKAAREHAMGVCALRGGVSNFAVAGDAFFLDDCYAVESGAQHPRGKEARDASAQNRSVAFSRRVHAGGWIRFATTIVTCMGARGFRCFR